jgi:uncharacterized OB-fold protein
VAQRRVVENTLEFPYTRTLGPVVGAFVAGLRAGHLTGVRSVDGRVLVPPCEYDPTTGAPLTEMVEVGPAATVVGWTWVETPGAKHPLDHPFAFALIRPDGADTAMVHALDAPGPEAVRVGMRVVPRWRQEPTGRIDDIECFEATS